MAKTYKFDPPTQDELDSVEHLSSTKATVQPQAEDKGTLDNAADTAEDFLKGGAQGLTFGGGTKGLAAMQASYDMLTGKADPKAKFSDLYDKYKNENEASVQKSMTRSPIATRAGEIGGAVLSPINKIAAPIAGLAGLGEATGIGANLAKGAVEGSALGATAGAINQGEGESLPHAAIKGALIGGGAGVVGSGLSQLAKGAVNKVLANPNTEYGQIGQEAFAQGKGGQGINSLASKNEIIGGNTALAENTTTQLRQAGDAINSKYGEVLAAHPDTIHIEDPTALDDLTSVMQDEPTAFGVSKREAQSMGADLQKVKAGQMSAPDLKDLQGDLREYASSVDPKYKHLFDGVSSDIDKALSDQVEGYPEVNDAYRQHKEILESLGGVPDTVNQSMVGEANKPYQQTFGRVLNLTKGAWAPGTTDVAAKETMQNFQQKLSQLQSTPEGQQFLKEFGINPDALTSDINNQSKLYNAMRTVQGTSELGGAGWGHFLTGLSPKGLYYRGANLSGQIAGQGEGLYGGIGRIVNAPKQVLSGLADKLESHPGTQVFGENLNQALDNPANNMARTTALFNIMQNPNARKTISESGNNEEGNK